MIPKTVFIVSILLLVLITPNISYQQGLISSSAAILETTKAGLQVADIKYQENDIESAEYAIEVASRHFGLGLSLLRESDNNITDEIHLDLLDIPQLDTPAAVDVIAKITEQLDIYDIPISDSAVVDLLTISDEQYQISERDENQVAYDIAKILFSKASEIYKQDADETIMLDLEQISFFNDLTELVENRESYSKVGLLVGAIQRDLTGAIASHDQIVLYNTIRSLYAEMILAIDSGDYTTAEEYAIEAYLENYEYIEPVLEAADAELMYSLEIRMREDLRDMIRDRQSPEEINSFLADILTDLDTGEAKTVEYIALNVEPIERELKERGDSTNEQQQRVRNEIDFIRTTLQDMLVHYENGDITSAYAAARTAYLDSYEHVEIPLRPINPDFTLEVEYQFAELRNMIKEQADIEDIRSISIAIERNLDESERLVTGTGQLAPIIAFTASFAIIFREGLESVLILGAIITYLEASRNNRFKKYIHYGILAAIGATAVTWFVVSYIIEISGASRELIEAIAALSATAVLFYVSFWILNKIEHKKWMEFVKAKVWQATTTGSVMVFVMLSFFTVYREGFETVLFYQAMFSFAKYLELYVGLGFVLGLGVLFLIYFVMRRLGKLLPLRALFGLTMGIGAYLSIAFIGNGIRELQIIDVVPYTSMFGIIPRLDINMATLTGIYPTLETVIAQLVLLGVYLVAATYVLIMKPKKEQEIAAMRKSRGKDI